MKKRELSLILMDSNGDYDKEAVGFQSKEKKITKAVTRLIPTKIIKVYPRDIEQKNERLSKAFEWVMNCDRPTVSANSHGVNDFISGDTRHYKNLAKIIKINTPNIKNFPSQVKFHLDQCESGKRAVLGLDTELSTEKGNYKIIGSPYEVTRFFESKAFVGDKNQNLFQKDSTGKYLYLNEVIRGRLEMTKKGSKPGLQTYNPATNQPNQDIGGSSISTPRQKVSNGYTPQIDLDRKKTRSQKIGCKIRL